MFLTKTRGYRKLLNSTKKDPKDQKCSNIVCFIEQGCNKTNNNEQIKCKILKIEKDKRRKSKCAFMLMRIRLEHRNNGTFDASLNAKNASHFSHFSFRFL